MAAGTSALAKGTGHAVDDEEEVAGNDLGLWKLDRQWLSQSLKHHHLWPLLLLCWADPGVLWKKAPRAMRAMRGKALETVPFQPYFGCTKSFLKVLSN